jgi:hypothetical protein
MKYTKYKKYLTFFFILLIIKVVKKSKNNKKFEGVLTMIEVYNEEVGLYEKYDKTSLDFIRRSYDQFKNKEMTPDDYGQLALILVKAKFKDSRFDNIEWKIKVEI